MEIKSQNGRQLIYRGSRIPLDTGETKTVSFPLDNDDFSYWDESNKGWLVEKGDFEIQLASSSQDIRETIKITAR